ncbi:MAG: outer membrane beta-barrel protein [Alphaproteobacteria bacterium]|nr:outer membrane beta-barrel protein [Alphaproteobacteria bacterium]MCL2758013.1 outer membrane beta-barrel protein [Alphaproteobacteria bacterium]
MKKILLTSALVLGVTASANANLYVGGGFGFGGSADDGIIRGNVGWAFGNGFRLEANVFQYNPDSNVNANNNVDVDVTLQGGEFYGSVNEIVSSFGIWEVRALYDIKQLEWRGFTPSVGLGLSHFSFDFQRNAGPGSQSITRLTMDGSFILGVSYALTDRLNLDLEYNRVWEMYVGKMGWSTSSDARKSDFEGTNLFKLGVRYTF